MPHAHGNCRFYSWIRPFKSQAQGRNEVNQEGFLHFFEGDREQKPRQDSGLSSSLIHNAEQTFPLEK